MTPRRYDSWLFEAYRADPRSLAAFRVLYATFMLAWAVPAGLWASDLPGLFYNAPLSPTAWLTDFAPRPAVVAVNVALAVALVALLLGVRTRAASLATVGLLVLVNSLAFSTGKIVHSVPLVLLPAALAFADWGAAWSWDARRRGTNVEPNTPGWPLAGLALAMSLMMVSAGVPKAASGWLDLDTSALRGHVAKAEYVHGTATPLGNWLTSTTHPRLLEPLDWATVVLELGFGVAFLHRRLFRGFLAAATGFHLGVMLTMEITSVGNVLLYAAFVPWAAAADRLTARLPSLRRIPAGAFTAAGVLFAAACVVVVVRTGEPTTARVPLSELLILAGGAVGVFHLLREGVRLAGAARQGLAGRSLPSPSARVRRGVIRSLPLAVLAFCLWGYAAERAGLAEPYPSLRLPGFGKVFGSGDEVTTKRAVVRFAYADGARKRVDQDRLLENFSGGARNILATVYLRGVVEKRDDLDGAGPWKRGGGKTKAVPRRIHRLLPGLQRGKGRRHTEKFRVKLVDWLRRRAGDVRPGAHPVSAELYVEETTHIAGEPVGESRLVGPVTFPLSPDAPSPAETPR